jgi:hypothetical protein
MPRVTVRNARTETLRGTLETELGRWGHEGPPERFKPLFAEIEAELKYRDERLEHHCLNNRFLFPISSVADKVAGLRATE